MKRQLLTAGLTLLLLSCMRTETVTTKVPVAASIYPYAFLAERVGGEFVSVTTITPPGVEPHDFDPLPQQIASVYEAKLFLWNGQEIDPWAGRIEPQIEGNDVKTLEITKLGDLLPAIHQEEDVPEAEDFVRQEASDDHGEFDPHVWLDPVFMIKATEHIRDDLILVDSAHEKTYRANAAALIKDLKTLDRDFQKGLTTCALKEIVVSHDAFRYLSSRYAFFTIAIAGLSPEEEPSAKVMAEITDLVRQKGIKHIFTETLASPKLTEAIARETGAAILSLNPLEGLTEAEVAAGETYLSVMRTNLDALRTAMRCS